MQRNISKLSRADESKYPQMNNRKFRKVSYNQFLKIKSIEYADFIVVY